MVTTKATAKERMSATVANEVKNEWERLKAACQEARLPQPQMSPGGLSETFQIFIPGYKRRMSRDAHEAIQDLSTWVYGYQAGLKAMQNPCAEVCDEVTGDPIAEAARLAKQVLDSDGLGGPCDHETLAKAVLHLSVALLERSNATNP